MSRGEAGHFLRNRPSRRVELDDMPDHVFASTLSEGSTLPIAPPAARKGPWRLICNGRGETMQRRLGSGESIVIGSRHPADWVVSDAAVSALHARISATADGLRVEDLGSRNGTFLAGARLRQPMVITERASLHLGRSYLAVAPVESGLARMVPSSTGIPELVGSSEPMQRLAEGIRRVAALNAPVLLQGESGTGKDVVARAIHRLSGREGRYVPVNAGSLSDSLADSELFGHRRGAFTGALQSRAGAFEQADKGTLFLDEVAELAPAVQAKLLRAVELGEVRPLGATSAIVVSPRIITATWAPLVQRVAELRFREDLYHRISTFVLELPPLRSRKSDIVALAESFFQRERGQLGDKRLAPAALARLVAHNFPGNVRELFAILYRAAVMTGGEEIGALDIDAATPRGAVAKDRCPSVDVRRLLEAHDGNVSAAARSAKVARSTFRSWLKRSEALVDESGDSEVVTSREVDSGTSNTGSGASE